MCIWRVDSITPLALCEGATTTPRTTAPGTTTTTSTVAPATTSKATLTTTKRLTTTKNNSRGVSLWVFACQPAKDSHKNTMIPDTTAITYAQKPINTRRSGPASAFQGRRGTAKSLHFVATTMFKRRPTAQINARPTRIVAATPGTSQIKCAHCTTTNQLRASMKGTWCASSSTSEVTSDCVCFGLGLGCTRVLLCFVCQHMFLRRARVEGLPQSHPLYCVKILSRQR